MKINIKKIFCFVIVIVMLVSTNAVALRIKNDNFVETSTNRNVKLSSSESVDIDPLVDLKITFTVTEIRALDIIDRYSDPDFYVKLFVNEEEFVSGVWHDRKYVKDEWRKTVDVPDDVENVSIKIQLWDKNPIKDVLCDLSKNYQSNTDKHDVDLVYNLKTGHWSGGDYISREPVFFDESGYGHLNGCDDNSIKQNDRDCELWFDITQNDFDGDGIPYWTEVNVFNTDPEVDNTGEDIDEDGVPIEWEYKWGYYLSRISYHPPRYKHIWFYNPFEWENHAEDDPDEDGLDNVEEYLTSQWRSDPFRQDIFLELDQMELGPNGEGAYVPDLSLDMLWESFVRHNIVFHIDDGSMGEGELIPFKENTTTLELREHYFNYFLNGDVENWRQGVFHYAIMVYNCTRHPGFVFWGGDEGDLVTDCFQLSTKYHETRIYALPLLNILINKKIDREYRRAVVYASGMMHETGHTLGIYGSDSNTPGCDDPDTHFPWEINWWAWITYESCMNYGRVYQIVDYSDGSRGKNDFDDWNNIDLTLFQRGILR